MNSWTDWQHVKARYRFKPELKGESKHKVLFLTKTLFAFEPARKWKKILSNDLWLDNPPHFSNWPTQNTLSFFISFLRTLCCVCLLICFMFVLLILIFQFSLLFRFLFLFFFFRENERECERQKRNLGRLQEREELWGI